MNIPPSPFMPYFKVLERERDDFEEAFERWSRALDRYVTESLRKMVEENRKLVIGSCV